MKNYSDLKEKPIEKKQDININDKFTMKIIPNNNKNLDESLEYIIKDKIKKFFSLKKNKIKYVDLLQLMLQYLINNNLVIGNYFVLSNKLSKFLNINPCVLININEVKNILTYFVEL